MGRDNIGPCFVTSRDFLSQRSHGFARYLAAGAALLTLAGCSLLPPELRPHAAAHAPIHHYHHPETSTGSATGSAAAAGRLNEQVPAPEPAPVRVVGLSQDSVHRLLGAPASQTQKGPAQSWTYEGDGCSVVVTFYYDVTRSGFFALSQKLLGGGDGAACLGRIHDAHGS